MVRFARLMQRRVRALGRPPAGAASGGNRSLTWLPHRVIWITQTIDVYLDVQPHLALR